MEKHTASKESAVFSSWWYWVDIHKTSLEKTCGRVECGQRIMTPNLTLWNKARSYRNKCGKKDKLLYREGIYQAIPIFKMLFGLLQSSSMTTCFCLMTARLLMSKLSVIEVGLQFNKINPKKKIRSYEIHILGLCPLCVNILYL